MRSTSRQFRVMSAALAALLIGLIGVVAIQSPAVADDEACSEFGYVESHKVDNLTETTYAWPDGYTIAVVKAGSDQQDLGHELVFRLVTDPITHSSGKELSHIHFCVTPEDPANPDIEILKTGTEKAHQGDTVNFSFAVTNTGDVGLVNVSVDDDVLGHIGDIPSLAVDQTVTLEFETVAPADDVTNTATACGVDSQQTEVCDDDDHTLDVIHPGIEIEKTGADNAEEGDEVEYSFEVTNTGDVPLTDVSVDDDVLGHVGDIPTLAVDQKVTLTKTVAAPATDTRNEATACGDDPLDLEVCDDDDHTIDIQHPGIDIVKTGETLAHEGDEVTYTFAVHNIGDVVLTAVSVDDDVLGHIGDIESLGVGATTELTKTMTVAEATDEVDNEATACGTALSEVCDTDIHHLTVIHPALTIDKRVGGGDHKPVGDALVGHAGDELGYTVVVTNTGDTALEITALTDTLNAELLDSCSQGIGSTLEPGAVITCAYTTTAESVDTHNVVSVAGVDEIGGEKGTVDGTDETFVRVIDPEIQIVKTANPESVEPGQDVTYTYVVTNVGDTGLVDIGVVDDKLGDIGTVDALAPGDSATLTETVTIQADSPRVNLAVACGIDELELLVCDADDATIAIVLPLLPEGRDSDSLPTTGFNVLAWVAVATTFIAAGLKMSSTRGRPQKT